MPPMLGGLKNRLAKHFEVTVTHPNPISRGIATMTIFP